MLALIKKGALEHTNAPSLIKTQSLSLIFWIDTYLSIQVLDVYASPLGSFALAAL